MKPRRAKSALDTHPPGVSAGSSSSPWRAIFPALLGALLGLALCKFGNPAFLASYVVRPTDLFEWLLTAWPIRLGQLLLLGVALVGFTVIRWPSTLPLWVKVAPLPWLVWQWIATAMSGDLALSVPITIHLTSNVVCFYLGMLCLAPAGERPAFWVLLLAGYCAVLLSGWQQHFGGLEASREFIQTELSPEQLAALPPEFVKRMNSGRIFATLFYPNTLAGVVILLLPAFLGRGRAVFPNPRAFRILAAVVTILSLGCLVWSGSKAGWLLALAVAFVALLRLPMSTKARMGLAMTVLVLGIGGFYARYSGYLERGATSVVARLDYWQAAARITAAHPLFGAGPGSFAKQYERIKRPESEMARAAHNDYIQQASDSGVPGLVTFVAFVAGLVVWTGVQLWSRPGWAVFLVWLGVFGIALHLLTEFGFYIPAISWVFMVLMGWLAAQCGNTSTPTPAHP